MSLATVRQSISKFMKRIGLRYVLAVCLSIWAISVQMHYRIPGSFLFLLLPAVGGALTLINLILLINLFLARLPDDDPFRVTLGKVDWWASLVVRVFVYYTLLLFANGVLDKSLKTYHPAQIMSITEEMPLGVPLPYAWVTVRDRNDPEQLERVLLKWSERRRLWGAEPVALDVREGYFGIPWVGGIKRDWDHYGRKILELTPTASLAWKKIIRFNIEHNRINEAVEATHEYLKLYPKDSEWALTVASILFGSRHPEEAIQFADYAVSHRPTYNGYQMLGAALSYSGHNLRAADVLEASKPLNPLDWEAYYHLGYVYEELRAYEKAVENFEVVRERWGNNPEVQQKIRSLKWKIKMKESRRGS